MDDFIEGLKEIFKFGLTIAIGITPVIIITWVICIASSHFQNNNDTETTITIEETETSSPIYINNGNVLYEDDKYILIEDEDTDKVIVIQK